MTSADLRPADPRPLTDEERDWVGQHFDPKDSARLRDPQPYYRALREDFPAAHSDAHEDGFWVISRYDDVRKILLDTRRYASGPSHSIPAFGSSLPMVPLDANGERHSRFRRIANEPMTGAAISRFGYEDRIREITRQRLRLLSEAGRGDLMSEIAFWVPAAIMFAEPLLGRATDDDDVWLSRLREHIFDLKYVPERSREASAAMEEVARKILADRAEQPGDDIPSRLVAAVAAGEADHDEAVGMIVLLFFGGIETPANAIGLQLLHLVEHPEDRARLKAEPGLVASAVEELHRYYGPSQGGRRTLLEDVELHGNTLRKGDPVWVMKNAANHDATVFDQPSEIRLDRSPNRHVGYGVGAHRCPGAQIATLMLNVIVEEFVAWAGAIELAPGARPAWTMGTSRVLESLDVVLRP